MVQNLFAINQVDHIPALYGRDNISFNIFTEKMVHKENNNDGSFVNEEVEDFKNQFGFNTSIKLSITHNKENELYAIGKGSFIEGDSRYIGSYWSDEEILSKSYLSKTELNLGLGYNYKFDSLYFNYEALLGYMEWNRDLRTTSGGYNEFFDIPTITNKVGLGFQYSKNIFLGLDFKLIKSFGATVNVDKLDDSNVVQFKYDKFYGYGVAIPMSYKMNRNKYFNILFEWDKLNMENSNSQIVTIANSKVSIVKPNAEQDLKKINIGFSYVF